MGSPPSLQSAVVRARAVAVSVLVLVAVCVLAVGVVHAVSMMPPSVPYYLYYRVYVWKIVKHVHAWHIGKLLHILKLFNVKVLHRVSFLGHGLPLANITIVYYRNASIDSLEKVLDYAMANVTNLAEIVLLNYSANMVKFANGSIIVPVYGSVEDAVSLGKLPSSVRVVLYRTHVGNGTILLPIVTASIVGERHIDWYSRRLIELTRIFAKLHYVTVIVFGQNLNRTDNGWTFLKTYCTRLSTPIIVVEPSLRNSSFTYATWVGKCLLLDVPGIGIGGYSPVFVTLGIYYPSTVLINCISLKNGRIVHYLTWGACGRTFTLSTFTVVPSQYLEIESSIARGFIVYDYLSLFFWTLPFINITGLENSLPISQYPFWIHDSFITKYPSAITSSNIITFINLLTPWIRNIANVSGLLAEFTNVSALKYFYTNITLTRLENTSGVTVTFKNVTITNSTLVLENTSTVKLAINRSLIYSGYILSLDLGLRFSRNDTCLRIVYPYSSPVLRVYACANGTLRIVAGARSTIRNFTAIRHLRLITYVGYWGVEFACVGVNTSLSLLPWTCINLTGVTVASSPNSLTFTVLGNGTISLAFRKLILYSTLETGPYPVPKIVTEVLYPETVGVGSARLLINSTLSIYNNKPKLRIVKGVNVTYTYIDNRRGILFRGSGNVTASTVQVMKVHYPITLRKVWIHIDVGYNYIAGSLNLTARLIVTLHFPNGTSERFSRNVTYINITNYREFTVLLNFSNIELPPKTTINVTVILEGSFNGSSCDVWLWDTYVTYSVKKFVKPSLCIGEVGVVENSTACLTVLSIRRLIAIVGSEANITEINGTVSFYLSNRALMRNIKSIILLMLPKLSLFTAGYLSNKVYLYLGYPPESWKILAMIMLSLPSFGLYPHVPTRFGTLWSVLAGRTYRLVQSCIVNGTACVYSLTCHTVGMCPLLVNVSNVVYLPVIANSSVNLVNITLLDRSRRWHVPWARCVLAVDDRKFIIVPRRGEIELALPGTSPAPRLVCSIGNVTVLNTTLQVGTTYPTATSQVYALDNVLVTRPYDGHVRTVAWTSNVTKVRTVNRTGVLTILASGHGEYCLAVHYMSMPHNVTILANMTISYRWINKTLQACGSLSSTLNLTLVDKYALLVKILDMLGRAVPNVTVIVNGSSVTVNGSKLLILPAGMYNITLPARTSTGFIYYTSINNVTGTVPNNTMTLPLVNNTLLVAYYKVPVRISAHVHVVETGLGTVIVVVSGKVVDYYGKPLLNGTLMLNVTDLTGRRVIYTTLVKIRDGRFESPQIVLEPRHRYEISIIFLGTRIYATSSTALTYTTPSAVTRPPTPSAHVYAIGIALIVTALALLGLVIYLAVRHHKKRTIRAKTLDYA